MNDQTDDTSSRLLSLIAPIADDFDVELVDIDYSGGVLKVVIDQPGGVASGPLVDVTKAVSVMIDREDPLPGRFTLEVTSPGLERPLRKPAHFERAIGLAVSVKTMPDFGDGPRIEGVLDEVDEHGIRITSVEGEHSIPFGAINKARTVFEWGPEPKPGGHPKSTKESANQ